MVCTSQGGPLLPFALLHNLSLSALWLFSPLEDGQCSIFVSIPSVRRDLSGFPLALGYSLDESLGWRARGQLQQQMSSLLYVSLIASLTVSILSIVTHCASHPGASGWLPLERMAWHQLPSAAPVILLYYSTLQWGKNPTLTSCSPQSVAKKEKDPSNSSSICSPAALHSADLDHEVLAAVC